MNAAARAVLSGTALILLAALLLHACSCSGVC